jgi:hypothetical protein
MELESWTIAVDNMSISIVLETPRLILRRVQMCDVEGLHEVFKEPLAMKYWQVFPLLPVRCIH